MVTKMGQSEPANANDPELRHKTETHGSRAWTNSRAGQIRKTIILEAIRVEYSNLSSVMGSCLEEPRLQVPARAAVAATAVNGVN